MCRVGPARRLNRARWRGSSSAHAVRAAVARHAGRVSSDTATWYVLFLFSCLFDSGSTDEKKTQARAVSDQLRGWPLSRPPFGSRAPVRRFLFACGVRRCSDLTSRIADANAALTLVDVFASKSFRFGIAMNEAAHVLQLHRQRARVQSDETRRALIYTMNKHIALLGNDDMPARFTNLPASADDAASLRHWIDANSDALGQGLAFDFKPHAEWARIIGRNEATLAQTHGNFSKFIDLYGSLVDYARLLGHAKYCDVEKPKFLNRFVSLPFDMSRFLKSMANSDLIRSVRQSTCSPIASVARRPRSSDATATSFSSLDRRRRHLMCWQRFASFCALGSKLTIVVSILNSPQSSIVVVATELSRLSNLMSSTTSLPLSY